MKPMILPYIHLFFLFVFQFSNYILNFKAIHSRQAIYTISFTSLEVTEIIKNVSQHHPLQKIHLTVVHMF